MKIRWKKVKNWSFYKISNTGIVINTKTGHKMTNTKSSGYVRVHLSQNGKTRLHLLHIMLAEAFIPNPKNKPQINHIDGNGYNNKLSNLEWVTAKENTIHAYKTGLSPIQIRPGMKAGHRKIDEKQVKEIRKLYSTGWYTYKTLSLLYPIKETGIRYIIKKINWSHIK